MIQTHVKRGKQDQCYIKMPAPRGVCNIGSLNGCL